MDEADPDGHFKNAVMFGGRGADGPDVGGDPRNLATIHPWARGGRNDETQGWIDALLRDAAAMRGRQDDWAAVHSGLRMGDGSFRLLQRQPAGGRRGARGLSLRALASELDDLRRVSDLYGVVGPRPPACDHSVSGSAAQTVLDGPGEAANLDAHPAEWLGQAVALSIRPRYRTLLRPLLVIRGIDGAPSTS